MNRLWYYRREHDIIGPVPQLAIQRYLLLGRLGLDEEVSPDSESWLRIEDCPEFASTCQLIQEGEETELAAARRYSDERNLARRTDSREQAGDQRRSDRREDEPPEITELRAHRAALFKPQQRKNWMGYILLACLVALVLLAIMSYQPVNPIKIIFTRP